MSTAHQAMVEVFEEVKKRNPNEPEFHQAVKEILESLEPVVEKHPEFIERGIIKSIVEPERIIKFRVPWVDDNGNVQINRGYRIQFNSAIGPYKGGLRFHPSVYEGIIKFLGFEQIFKNSLTGLPIGGGKGGSDFDPTGRSDAEIMRFCQSFMRSLYRYIGPDVDVPAGDVGVGIREISYLFGEYRHLKGVWENGVLTGKDFASGGSRIRPEATGYGAVYYLQNVLRHEGEDIAGKRIACAGFGNVTWGICKKAMQLGAKVVTLSGPDGYIYDPDGVSTDEKVNYLVTMRNSGRDKVQDYADKFGCEFFPKEKPWGRKVDVIMPSATQNDVTMPWAEKIVANGIKYYIMDRYIGGNDYEYRLESKPVKTECMAFNTLYDAVKYLHARPWDYHEEYSNLYKFYIDKKVYIYDADSKLLRELKDPEVLTGWHDSFEECLQTAKLILEDKLVEWYSSCWLDGELFLILDENLKTTLLDKTLVYNEKYGLYIEGE